MTLIDNAQTRPLGAFLSSLNLNFKELNYRILKNFKQNMK